MKKLKKIEITKNPLDACRKVVQLLRVLVNRGGGTVALSGGQTPKLLFQVMAEEMREVNWGILKFFWVDERMVSAESDESNFGVFRRALIDTGIVPLQSVFPIVGVEPQAEQAEVERYTAVLRKEVKQSQGFPTFDLILLGMGSDGHTASIFHDNLLSFAASDAVEAVAHPVTGRRRITLTGRTLNRAIDIAFLCIGADKALVVNDVVMKEYKVLPAACVHPQQNLWWILDEGAASNKANYGE